MRLINSGVGELSDRLSVLTLKILHKGERDHWKAERAQILGKLGARSIGTTWLDGFAELAATNAAIWQYEDELREWRGQYKDAGPLDADQHADVVKIAFRLQELNDRRHELIAAINKHAGDHVGSEKV